MSDYESEICFIFGFTQKWNLLCAIIVKFECVRSCVRPAGLVQTNAQRLAVHYSSWPTRYGSIYLHDNKCKMQLIFYDSPALSW